MLLPSFEILEPETLDALHEILRGQEPGTRILAGGTDLLPDLKREYDRRNRFPSGPAFRPGPFPEILVSLARIPGLGTCEVSPDGNAVFGPLVTMAELSASPEIEGFLGALSDGAGSVGSPQVRNRATFGGNLCNARPCADTAPATVALEGVLELESASGKRRAVKAESFFTGPGSTVLEPGEILTAVRFRAPEHPVGSAYVKLGTRKAYEITLVSAAAALWLSKGRIEKARIVLGSVAPVPLLATEASGFLEGKTLEDSVLRRAAQRAAGEARPIDDFRGSAAYRKEMAEVLAFRALLKAWRRSQESGTPEQTRERMTQ